MPRRQFCTPHIVSASKAKSLTRIAFEDREFRENWYQSLLFENPSLIPVDDIEPAFGPLIALARELHTGKGPVDIAYINPSGYITLVETKLWRNPEARRDVVAQIIEYATGMAKWTYADLCDEVRRARREATRPSMPSMPNESNGDPILPLMQDRPDFDEANFIDKVSSNLRKGRFLLLIVGDGIQEGIEELAEAMQESPHLGFTLALVETAVYKFGENGEDFLVQPRVLVRTREIVRHVIEVRNEHPTAVVSVRRPEVDLGPKPPRPRSITETAYYEQLERSAGKNATEFVRWLTGEVERTPDLHMTWSKDGPAVWWMSESDSGNQAGFLRLRASGELSSTNWLPSFCAVNGLPLAIAENFQRGLMSLLPDTQLVERGNKGYTQIMGKDGNPAKFAPLAGKRHEFWELIGTATSALSKAFAAQRVEP